MKLHDLTKEELIEEVKKLRARKKYGLVWEDKPENVVEQCKIELPVLEEVAEKAIAKDEKLPTNLIIEGDNYHVLSVLNYTHQGKIDVIYIDPPYNTGRNDFKYNDRFVDREDTFRHSKWLSFMSSRLKLSRELLTDNGLIFISIDDNEMANLKLMCDEIFLENNFLAIQIWRGMHTVRNSSKEFNHNTEYVLTYAKNMSKLITTGDKNTYIRIASDKASSYTQDDNDGNGPYKFDPISARNYYKPYTYTFKDGRIWQAPKGSYPRYSIESLKRLEESNAINLDGKEPKAKRFLKDVQEGVPPNTLIPSEQVGFNKDATSFLGQLFDDKVFDQPKPTNLIKYLLSIKNKKRKDHGLTVLDFFAGSGTTGHAVLELNKEDGGNRKFILCTNNENKIAEEVCYPRIKKVIEGYGDTKGIPANVRYFKTAFVSKSKVSDDTRQDLVHKSVEMICVRENTFEKVQETDDYKIYQDSTKVTAILFNLEEVETFKKEIAKQGKKAQIYVFSLTHDTYNSDFADLTVAHKLCPIPESILEVYRKLFKE
ncbi:MAG: site-specific DNA-methyltransferase [Candidatus Roizmanbacteria bacterium]